MDGRNSQNKLTRSLQSQ